VLADVELDGQLSAGAKEVDDEGTTRVLTAELDAGEAVSPEAAPKRRLRGG